MILCLNIVNDGMTLKSSLIMMLFVLIVEVAKVISASFIGNKIFVIHSVWLLCHNLKILHAISVIQHHALCDLIMNSSYISLNDRQ